MRFKSVLAIVLLALLCLPFTQSYAETYSLVKTINLIPLVGDRGSIEVDVVGNQLYVANWIQDKYFKIDPVTEEVVGSFSLSNGSNGIISLLMVDKVRVIQGCQSVPIDSKKNIIQILLDQTQTSNRTKWLFLPRICDMNAIFAAISQESHN